MQYNNDRLWCVLLVAAAAILPLLLLFSDGAVLCRHLARFRAEVDAVAKLRCESHNVY
jgi:hypothetical protein